MSRNEAAKMGANGLVAWASKAVLLCLADTGVTTQSEVAHIGVPTRSAREQGAALQPNWWFMGGDTDFL
jgi:hypothetical protein